MRSTVRIDDDLLTALKEEARRQGTSLTRMLNRALRAGLHASRHVPERKRRFRQETVALGEPRVDLDKALGIAATLEDEATLQKAALRK